MTKKATQKATYPHKIHIVLDKNRESIKPKEAPISQQNKANDEIKVKFDVIVRELENLVGLDDVKKLVYEIFALIHISQQRITLGLKADQQVFHMIFKGNPGTGKTTVARLMARMFKELGILSKGHLIEVSRADLVGEYIGHTAQKTREHVKKALGGILFIDEAYSLIRGGDKDFGRESIDCLVKEMEDHRNEFILVLAGYSYEMEAFIRANPGIHSRFPIQLQFEDYTVDQLLEIAEVMVKERDYILSSAAKQRIKNYIYEEMNNPLRSFSNARLIRNWIEKAVRNQAVRLLNESQVQNNKQILMTIQQEDLFDIKGKF